MHDIFNFLSVLVLLPLELATRYLERVSGELVKPLIKNNVTANEVEILNAITKPLTHLVIQIDSNKLDLIAQNLSFGNESLRQLICRKKLKNGTIADVECKLAKN